MPSSRRNVVGFTVVGVLLGIFFNPFSTSATPMITQEFMRSPTASDSNPDSQSPNMRGMQIFDIVFALSLRAAYRLFLRTLSLLQPDNLLQSWAEALGVVGTDGATASATDGGDALPSTQPTPQPISANPQPEAVAGTHDCATAASDHRHRASAESA